MRPLRLPVLTVVAAATVLTAMTGCAQKSKAMKNDGSDSGAIQVVAKDDSCAVSKKAFPAGKVELAVENKGTKVTEVYVLFPDGRILTERENIGPGTKADLTAEVKAGAYEITCKPGMKGDGIRQKVVATGGAQQAARNPEKDAAVAAYRTYVREQAEETLPKAQVFADAVKAGDLEAAKKAYAPSRIGWERTEPVAESFGDIDPMVDLREDGVEETGKPWTGWHRLEKALWQDKKIGDAEKKLADTLIKDLGVWVKKVGTAEITPSSMANGAKELLDEVATGKVTGEEERYSHTDLVDFKANVEGAEKAYTLLKPVASKSDPKLTAELDKQFAALDKLLDKHRPNTSSYDFVSYDKVGKADRKTLSDGVNALAEPLSKLAAAVTK
ncbi:iron uptake system protein EfeO [Streptomyces sp. NPDC004111]|uniref:iron uptake system protein EfeO n=1 Tax=Streptomyces sp. NPDC004111 TaxID=3364690 RepID=UPI0036938448